MVAKLIQYYEITNMNINSDEVVPVEGTLDFSGGTITINGVSGESGQVLGFTNTGDISFVALANGPQGPAGPTGVEGPTGPQGDTGAQGPQGDTGAQGPQGDTGAQGPQGDTGAQGPQGDEGAQGPQGDTGAQGPQGDTGAQGPQGDTGAQGPQGDTGAQGPQGDTGAQGPQGDTGAQGPQGDEGAQGPQGDTGAQGPQGDTGAQGPQGDTGAQGPQGDTGAQGPQGPAGSFSGADISQNLIPYLDNSFNLGSSSKQWKDVYANNLITSDLSLTNILNNEIIFKSGNTINLNIDTSLVQVITNNVNRFGSTLDFDNSRNNIIIGASLQKTIYFYDFSSTINQYNTNPFQTISTNNDYFSQFFAISKDSKYFAASDIFYNNQSGRIIIYDFSNVSNNWEELQEISGDNPSANLGRGIDFNASGELLVVGGPYYNSNKGIFRIYKKQNNSWNNIQTICGENNLCELGMYVSVANDADIFAVGEAGSGLQDGKVYIYELSSNNINWSLKQTLNADLSNSTEGNRILFNDNGTRLFVNNQEQDKIYIYDLQDNSFILQNTINNLSSSIPDNSINFGMNIWINESGNKLIVGSRQTQPPYYGYIHIYYYNNYEWILDSSFTKSKIKYGISIVGDNNFTKLFIGSEGNQTNDREVDYFNIDLTETNFTKIKGNTEFENKLMVNDLHLSSTSNIHIGSDYGVSGEVIMKTSNGLTWSSVPAGPTGPQGPAGPAGGPAGPVGPAGPTGPAGTNGINGNDGDEGPIGPAGPTGPAGPPGIGSDISLTDISCDLIHDGNSNRNIGSSSKKWDKLYVEDIYSNHIVPNSHNSYDLGTSTVKFRNHYLSGSIYSNYSQPASFYTDYGESYEHYIDYAYIDYLDSYSGGDINLYKTLKPGSSNSSITLGTSSLDFSNIYSRRVTVGSTIITSDDRLKHNEKDISNALNVIKLLKPQSYDMTENFYDASYTGEISGNYKHMSGFIAQEIREIDDLSYCFLGKEFDQSGNPTRVALDYNSIFTYGIAGIKELHNMVENLKDENKLLKNKLNEVLTELGKDTI